MKRIIFLILCLLLLTSCSSCKNTITYNGTVLQDLQFDSIYANISIEDFNNLGFEFGDSVNVEFSNGLKLQDIPYYNGFFTRKGEPLVCGYPGYEYIAITKSASGMWNDSGLKQGDGVTITLKKKGKYLINQEALSQNYSNELSDYKDEESFANFRSIKLSTINDNYIFRGASPCDNKYGRALITDELLKENSINYVIDLSDSEEEFIDYDISNDSYIRTIYYDNRIVFLDMSADYDSLAYREGIVKGFKRIIDNSGPFYIHCTEGKDRTGFVCFVLEALTGANYDEMLDDYMKTYENYYGITKDLDEEKYKAIEDTYFRSFTDYIKEPYKEGCINYLIESGMEQGEIDSLIDKISK